MFRITHRSLTAAAGGLALLAMLTACAAPAAGQGAGGDSKIATLEKDAPTSIESDDPLFAEYGKPVRLRLDMTDEEEVGAWQPRDRCLTDHTAAPQGSSEGGGGQSSRAVGEGSESAAEAETLCLRLAPLPPWELDAQNPDALRFAQRVVDCLHERGVREVEITDADQFGRINIALGGEANDSASISLGMQHTDSCMASASEEVTP